MYYTVIIILLLYVLYYFIYYYYFLFFTSTASFSIFLKIKHIYKIFIKYTFSILSIPFKFFSLIEYYI